MKKYLIITLVGLLFCACSVHDPLSSSISGMVTSIKKEKVIGAKITKIQTVYNVDTGIQGIYFNNEIKGLDINVGDYIVAKPFVDKNNNKINSIKVNKGGETSIMYYINENEEIIETKEVKY